MSYDPHKTTADDTRIGPGILVLVVGASGVGKDALISGARAMLTDDRRFVFPERVVTRKPHEAEEHASPSETEFAKIERKDGFALVWEAHGLRYGVPAHIDTMLHDGRTVVVNGSRTIVSTARRRYVRVSVIVVECATTIRAERLVQRGRETQTNIEARLSRNVATFDPDEADVRIDNSGALADGINAFVAALRVPRPLG